LKGRKVVFPYETPSGFFHLPDIQLLRNMPGSPPVKNRSQMPIQDPIFIDLTLGTPSGMKALIHFLYFLDHHIRGEEAVERPLNGLDIQLALRFEVGHLPQGMDTGIRSSGPQKINLLACQRG
jgi:hypothetical protein